MASQISTRKPLNCPNLVDKLRIELRYPASPDGDQARRLCSMRPLAWWADRAATATAKNSGRGGQKHRAAEQCKGAGAQKWAWRRSVYERLSSQNLVTDLCHFIEFKGEKDLPAPV